MKIVFAHINAANSNFTFGDVIQSWNQADQRRFGRSGSSQNTHGFSRRKSEVNITEYIVTIDLFSIVEVDMVKYDFTILDFFDSIFWTFKIRNLVDDFNDTLCGS